MQQIRAYWFDDVGLRLIWDNMLSGEAKESSLDLDGVLRIEHRVCVPRVGDWIRLIL